MSLTGVLNADITGFKKGMKDAGGAANALNSTFAKVGAGLGAYLSVEGLKSFTNHLAGIGEAADRLGLGGKVEEFQKLTYAANQSGAGMENVETGMRKMQDAIGSALNGDEAAKKKLNGIGLAVADLASMSPDKQFDAVAAAIAGIQDPAQRTAAAIDIFGKQGAMLLPMLENLQALKNEASAVGAVIDGDLIKAMKRAQDQGQATMDVLIAFAANSGIAGGLLSIADAFNAIAVNANKAAAIGGGKNQNWFERTFVTDMTERFDVTAADKKKLADYAARKAARGGKTNAEIKTEDTAAQKAKVEAEKSKSLNEKNAKIVDDKITSLQADVDLQDAKNKGLEIEGQRLKTIAELQKQIGRELNAQELANVNKIYAQKQSLKAAENEKEASKTIKEKALDIRDNLLKKAGTDTLFNSMKRSIEEKTGSSLSADNSARLQELANIQNAMTSGDAMQKYSMPEMQTQTNELARMGGFAGSVASPKAEQINQQIANYTKEQNDLLKKANELIAKIGDLK